MVVMAGGIFTCFLAYLLGNRDGKVRQEHALDIANLILHIIIIAGELIVFYFTYAVAIEYQVVVDQVQIIMSELIADVQPLVATDFLQSVGPGLANQITIPDSTVADQATAASNSSIQQTAYITMGCTVGVGILLLLLLKHYFTLNIWEPDGKIGPFGYKLLENGVILLMVVLTEYAFLTYIGSANQPADPNYVKYSVVQAIRTYGQNTAPPSAPTS
ncbi:unnamed protein product [Sphagnum jensenii]|uniref:Uncharacterized protein n=1 Tax=Sphagnum jensenii TaxID=128206 RepID=A0ABP1A0Y7_9BRYO